jgi:hypothetical protein
MVGPENKSTTATAQTATVLNRFWLPRIIPLAFQ